MATERKSLDQLIAEGAVVRVGDETYEIGALKASDFGEFIAWAKKRNLRALFDSAQGVSPVVVSATAAKVLTGAMTDVDVLEEAATADGGRWLFERGLVRGGVPQKRAEKITETIEHMYMMDKVAMVLRISGFIKWRTEAEGDSANPPPETESTGGT